MTLLSTTPAAMQAVTEEDFLAEIERMMDGHIAERELPFVRNAAQVSQAAGDIARALMMARGMPSA